MTTINAGELFYFSLGEYSDYTIYGFVRALADFDITMLRGVYYEENPEYKRPLLPCASDASGKSVKGFYIASDRSTSGFIAFLIRKGLVEEVELLEFHDFIR